MSRILYTALSTMLILMSLSCNKASDEVAVARVFDDFLYKSELAKHISVTTSKEDSTKIADLYINNWLRERVVVHQANLNLSIDEASYEDRLETYKNELIIYDFENELIKQKLDDYVNEAEIKKYYDDNKDNYILKNQIAKYRFAMFPEGTSGLRQFGKWLRKNDEYVESIMNFSKDNASVYDVDGDRWVGFEELVSIIPIDVHTLKELVSSKSYGYYLEDGNEIFINILDSKRRGNIAPYEMVKLRIKSTILNKRKSELLKKMREDLFRESIDKGELEIFKQK